MNLTRLQAGRNSRRHRHCTVQSAATRERWCWQRRLLQAMVVLLAVTHYVQAVKEAAVWVDDGNGHTVKELLSPRESREFSQSLRRTMGLPEHRPHFRPKHSNVLASAPTFMKSIYNTLDELGIPRDENLDPAHRDALEKADTVVTFTSKAAAPPSSSTPAPRHHSPHRLLFFNTSEVSLDHTLLWAELRLHYQPRTPDYADQHLIEATISLKVLHVYLVTDAAGGEMEVAQTPLNIGGWLALNITAPTLAWMLQPRHNRGLRLAVTEEGRKHEHNLHSVGVATAHDREDQRPILVAFFTLPEGAGATIPTVDGSAPSEEPVTPADTGLLSRSVRSLPIPHRNGGQFVVPARGESSCQMRPLHVSFSDLDWQQWVIAPNGYDANYCEGRCEFPMPADMNATNHAIVQTLIKVLEAVKDGDRVPPAACCTPKDLLTISVLYYDYSDNVVLKKYPKMIVKNCACR